MSDQLKETRRAGLGYGSTYRKAEAGETSRKGITTVLGGQVWLVKPDQKARASHPCLWMQAGVVKFKNCANFYDCAACAYDHAMAEKSASGKQISWQAAMRRRPGLDRVCRHSLTGRIAKRACAYDYGCADCDFDQFFEDVWTPRCKSLPTEVQKIKGFDVPMDYCFHDGHAWARVENGGGIRVGLDDFSMKLLGRPDAFDLPLMGQELDQGKVGWGLNRKGNLADVRSPVGGVIVEVNSRVRENPGVANREPYGEGWLFMVRSPDIKATLNQLMTDQQSLSWMTHEVGRLEQMIEEVRGPLAADGGYLADDIYGNLPDLEWDRLTRAFLGT